MTSSTPRSGAVNSTASLTYAPFLLLGLFIWFVATIVFRLLGHRFFLPDNALVMSLDFIALTLVMPLVMYRLYALRQLDSNQRAIAAICFLIVGILLDAFTLYWFEQVFPNMPVSASRPFAAWLLWGYGISLLTALIPQTEQT